jgi:hypothetical protein
MNACWMEGGMQALGAIGEDRVQDDGSKLPAQSGSKQPHSKEAGAHRRWLCISPDGERRDEPRETSHR